jgi:lipoyl synthase
VYPLPEKSCPSQTSLPEQIRVSLGTAIVLNLLEGKLDTRPTTAYLMTYRLGKCMANCGFCAQARASKSNTELLSRISWPSFPTPKVLATMTARAKEGNIKRICIQALNYPDVFVQIKALVKEIKKLIPIPVSVSCQPLNTQNIELLRKAGVDRLGIALDAATEALFNKVKGSGAGGVYSWENQFNQLNEAIRVFGQGNVSTHIIVGLGEMEKEATHVIQKCIDLGVLPALFAFTPVRGTALEANLPPKIESYRRIQLARYLIVNAKVRSENMQFDCEGKIIGFGVSNEALKTATNSGLPFCTSGCPNCNRPYYNEKLSGPIYNYPRPPSQEEIEKIKKQLS